MRPRYVAGPSVSWLDPYHQCPLRCHPYVHSIVTGSRCLIPQTAFFSQSANWLRTRILNIMTNRPIVTIISNVNENQPSTIALVPTPDLTAPLPKSSAIVLAATDAVCCHNTDTSTKIEAMKMMARATCDTGREGKGFTSRSEPTLSSSSCQPGKVARRRKQTKAKIMAMML